MKRDIRVAHSPDSDDAFMFYALATRKIDTGDRNYVHLLNDIETLNRKALEGEYEVSAVSFHAYAYLSDKYALMSCGASMGRNYGPIVVSSRTMNARSIADKVVAIPGTLTTAFLALRLFEPNVKYEVVPSSTRFRKGSTRPGFSFTRDNSRTARSECTRSSILVNGGSNERDCPFPLAETS